MVSLLGVRMVCLERASAEGVMIGSGIEFVGREEAGYVWVDISGWGAGQVGEEEKWRVIMRIREKGGEIRWRALDWCHRHRVVYQGINHL